MFCPLVARLLVRGAPAEVAGAAFVVLPPVRPGLCSVAGVSSVPVVIAVAPVSLCWSTLYPANMESESSAAALVPLGVLGGGGAR